MESVGRACLERSCSCLVRTCDLDRDHYRVAFTRGAYLGRDRLGDGSCGRGTDPGLAKSPFPRRLVRPLTDSRPSFRIPSAMRSSPNRNAATLTELRLLRVLMRRSMAALDLAHAAKVSPGSVYVLLKRLQRKDLIRRTLADEAPCIRYEITARGKKMKSRS